MKQQQQSTLTAIVGIACRFPGANDYNQFWQNLEQGVNSITEIPPQRWSVEQYYSPNPQHPNKSISKWGGLISGVDQFDAQFFGISPREAQRMDPQQRIMLELSWSCIEDAGYSPLELSGSQVGVFMGVCNHDYNQLQHQNDNHHIEGHTATGTYTCIIPNRISHFFNFHGPSIPVDTACSSSLVAMHQAINAIKESECETALVGGISVLCTPTSYISFSQLGMLSPTGQCKTFDSKADGYVRGEGAGVILLKPLEKAIEDGDRIYGVIRGSGVNHGGRARTLTSPNIYAQAQVLRTAYTKANVAPNTVSYIETHGTGTPLGDPIEINGLKRGFRQLYQYYELPVLKTPYCGIGAVKTNIGHTEATAGIAGVIKVLLAMQHKKLPKIVNFEELNPRIDLKESPFYLISETQPWECLKTEVGEVIPRRAGISSFGFGGTNAHVVLEEAPLEVRSQKSEVTSEGKLHLLTLSAKTATALDELVGSYQNYLETHPELELADICYTANTGRAHFNHRLAIIASNQQQLQDKLLKYKLGEDVAGICCEELPHNSITPKIAFLFTGQGSQYLNMGRGLYETQPLFRKIIDKCDNILRSELEHSLLEVLYPEQNNGSETLIHQTAYTQPVIFAIEYALYQLWRSWGIKPEVVMGHSVGEYVAACVAGIFSLEDGLKLIAARGKLMQQLPSGGEMVSVMASESKVRTLLASYSEKVAIAAINGPESVVISGEAEAIGAICSNLESAGIKTLKLQVSHAFHSPLMTPMLAEFETIANQITYNQPQIPVISNVTGTTAENSIATAQYWVNHVCQPVRFTAGMQSLHQLGYETFLEIGPKPILLGMGRECLLETKAKRTWLPSLRPGKQDLQQMLQSLAQLYVRGVKVNWLEFDRDYARQKIALPTYPFQRRRYWITDLKNRKNQLKQVSESQQIQVNGDRITNRPKLTLLNPNSVSVPIASLLAQKTKRKLVQLTANSTQIEPLKLARKQDETYKYNSAIKNNIEHTQTQRTKVNLDINKVQESLKQLLANALYLEISEINYHQKFIDLGLDSVVGVEWIANINQKYGLNIKATKLYDYPTLVDLTNYIVQILEKSQKEGVNVQKYTPTVAAIDNQARQSEVSIINQVNLSEIQQVLQQKLADALYVDISEIDANQKFSDLGLDSIVGVEWITTINQIYRLNIKATKLYDYPTLIDLSEYIAQQISKTTNNSNFKESPEIHHKPVEAQENFRQQLRLILNQVANNELNIQAANQMIQQLKEKVKIRE